MIVPRPFLSPSMALYRKVLATVAFHPLLTSRRQDVCLAGKRTEGGWENWLINKEPILATDALRTIKRRSIAAGLSHKICRHTFRATGITAYLENGGTVEN